MYVTTKGPSGTHLLRQSDEHGFTHAAVVSDEHEAERLDRMLSFAAHAAGQVEDLQRAHAEVADERDTLRAEVDRLRRDLDVMRAAELAAQSDPTQTMPVTPPRATPPPETAGPFVLPQLDQASGGVWTAPTGEPSPTPSVASPSSPANGTPTANGTPLDDLTATLAPDRITETQLAEQIDPPRRGRRGNGKSREVPAGGSGD